MLPQSGYLCLLRHKFCASPSLPYSHIIRKASKSARTCFSFLRTSQHGGYLAATFPPMLFLQPLQNRVPRVQVLLPLPVKNRLKPRFQAVFSVLFSLVLSYALPCFSLDLCQYLCQYLCQNQIEKFATVCSLYFSFR